MIKNVKFVSVPTRDQQRGVEFWTKQVGFEVVSDQPFDDKQRWIELAVPGAETRLVLFNMGGEPGFQSFTFAANDVQKTYEEMSGRGVEFVQPPKTESWGTSAIFKDADGNQFVLSSE